MATPSIAMIPSGYKAEKVYSVLPTNGDGDLTFDRNSSATRVNKSGLIESVSTDIPRLDYSDGGCPSLLLEPASTNTQPYSEEFDNGVWSKTRASITTNDAISPSGLLDADKLVGVSGSSSYVFDGISATSGDSYVISVFAKYIDVEEFLIVTFLQSGNARFNILNGTVTSNTGTISEPKIENYGNGWYRCSCKFTATATENVNYGFFLDNVIGKSVHIWGAQVEEGDYVTSYIPTTSGTASRSADLASKTGLSSYINDSEGVLYAEIAALSDSLSHRRISISDGSISNLVYVSFDTNSNRILANANGKILSHTVSDETEFHKVAVLYNSTAPKLFINGVLVETETAMNAITGLNQVRFDSGVGSNRFIGKVKDVRVYNTVLTDLELQTLTTL